MYMKDKAYVFSMIQGDRFSHTKIEVHPSGKLYIYPSLFNSLTEFLTFAKKSSLISEPYSYMS